MKSNPIKAVRIPYMKRVVLFILISVHGLYAQVAEPVNVAFSMLSWDKTIKDVFYIYQGERVDLTIYNGTPTPVHQVVLELPLVFYRDGPLDEEGLPTRIPVASVKFEENSNDTLLLFMKLHDEPIQYRVVPVETGASENGTDIYKLFNMTKHRLIAQLKDERIMLQPGASSVLNAPILDKPNFAVMFALESKTEEDPGWKLVYKTQWPYRSGRSGMVFIIEDPKRAEELKVRRVYYQTVQAQLGAE